MKNPPKNFEELRARVIWEYARESSAIREFPEKIRAILKRQAEGKSPIADDRAMQTMWRNAERIVRFFMVVGAMEQFPKPWLSVPVALRRRLASIEPTRADVELKPAKASGFKSAGAADFHLLVQATKDSMAERVNEGRHLEREAAPDIRWLWTEGTRDGRKVIHDVRCIVIDWSLTNEEIAKAATRWIIDNRPTELPADNRGDRVFNFEAHLERIEMMRSTPASKRDSDQGKEAKRAAAHFEKLFPGISSKTLISLGTK